MFYGLLFYYFVLCFMDYCFSICVMFMDYCFSMSCLMDYCFSILCYVLWTIA